MLDTTYAQKIIDHSLKLGADFSDIFIERNIFNNITYTDNKVKNIQSGTDFGIGVRVIFGTKALYGHTNLTDLEELLRITTLLCEMDKKSAASGTSVDFSKLQNNNIHTITNGLNNDVSLEQKIKYLETLNQLTRKHQSISQVQLNTLQRMQDVEIYNSEGLHVQDQRNYARLAATAIAQDANEQATGFYGPGSMAGWDFIEGLNPEKVSEQITKQALTVLKADFSPAGKLPVVIDSGFGGVIFHEACGHSLETTSVQKKASVFHDKMGQQIANECVSAVDDGTMENEWGSLNYDDEGTPTQKTQLIKDGKLTSFLVDRVGELRTGHKRTGSGRKQSYKFAPASRMRNTFIEPGKYEKAEMISTIKNGIYAKQMGGGSVNPGTGEFNFSVAEGYLIEDGKVTRPIKGATLIGSGADVLQKISMVGNNFEQAAGMCGSVSGSIPTNVGQAALKVDEILVGGRA